MAIQKHQEKWDYPVTKGGMVYNSGFEMSIQNSWGKKKESSVNMQSEK